MAASSTTPGGGGEQDKPGVASFSFVQEPEGAAALRFVQALPAQPDPATPQEEREAGAELASSLVGPSTLPSSLAGAQMAASSPPSAPPLAPPAARPASGAAPSLLSSSPSLSSASPPPTQQQQPAQLARSSSRGRRRFTNPLVKLVSGSKDKRTKDDPASTTSSTSASASTASAAPAAQMANGGAPPQGRRSSSASRRPSLDETASSTSSVPHPTDLSSSSRSSRPPVSLPTIFRRRHSGSHSSHPSSIAADAASPAEARTSLDSNGAGGGGRRSLDVLHAQSSSSSNGSSAHLDGAASSISTAPTSPDRLAGPLATSPDEVQIGEGEVLSGEEKRRRGSLALATELSGRRGDSVEDLADFVAASGSSSTSPTMTSSIFGSRSTTSPSSTPTAAALAPSPTLSDSPAPANPARRLTLNVGGLSLADLRPSPSLNASSASPPAPSSTASDSPDPSALTSSRSSRPSQLERLGTLPRLLSKAAIPMYAVQDDEGQEPEESETDTEASSSSSSEDEGERYATSDEGPVTTRSPNATPAPTPGLAPATPRGRPITPGGLSRTSSRMPSLTGLSMSAASSGSAGGAAPGPSNWVSFAPTTPTPSIRTARPQPDGTSFGAGGGGSYFDLPRPMAHASPRTPRTPGMVPQTPLAPMSISDVARGKRPALGEDVDASAAGQAGPSAGVEGEGAAAGEEGPAQPVPAVRAGMYRMRSQSVVALASPSMVDSDDEPVGTAAITGLDPIWQTGAAGGIRTPGPSFLNLDGMAKEVQTSPPKAPLSPVGPKTPLLELLPPPGSPPVFAQPSQPASSAQARASRPSTAAGAPRMHRTRSMYELRDAPPAYSAVYRRPGYERPQVIEPRPEEGNEGLPAYTCAIHIEGFMPRKMEFTAPGVQAKDRAWKRQYVVLHGTSIKIYKFDLRTHPIPGEEDWSVIPADIAGHDGPPPLHFHEGEYGVDSGANGSTGGHGHGPLHGKFPLSLGDAKAKAKSRIIEGATASAQNQLLRHYSLQNAESGLAADYIKRKHVVRVRAEGEQFLLQAKDDRGVIDLIEALQAATNVALDLDARPLPKFITLPRRRRRRRPRPAPDGSTTAAAGPNSTAAGGAAAAAPATGGGGGGGGGGPEDRLGDMLAEEQTAYARRNQGTVM
ncbi:hypothetical protein JCM8097_002457 [Rhodosporidiobolus ruineniae]